MEDVGMEARIGQAAGKIWGVLNAKGPLVKTDIAKAAGLPNDVLNQGVGWLAREGKIAIEERDRKQLLKVK